MAVKRWRELNERTGTYIDVLAAADYDFLAARYQELEKALRWTWDNSKLLESAIPVPSSILKTYRSLERSQSDASVKQ